MTDISKRYEEKTGAGLRYGIIEVTSRCQLRCPGCYMVRRDKLGNGSMTLNQAVRILDLCREYRGAELETMDILGGEPLLWPHLKEYIEILISRGIKPWVFTNMISITPELAAWLYERRVHITGKWNIADSNDPDQIRLQVQMIGSTVDMARKMRTAIDVFCGVGYRDPLFRLQNLIRKDNIALVPDYIRFCRMRGIGVDLELMGSGEPVGPEYFEVAPTPEELADLIRTLEHQGRDYMQSSASAMDDGLWPEFKNPRAAVLMPHLFGSCPFYDKGLYFAVDGSIRACSNSTVPLGHVDDPDPIRAAYESDLICSRLALTQETVGEPCGSCDRWDKCRGGCRATVEGMGDPCGGYTLCPLPHLKED
ncbi:MAG TPA: hypothetical protein DCS29_02375 [Candidatus Magasanikbacteria bacterium]|nr:hypothetical protein [Candidatus Magasanikbacteria bacterium]